MGPPRPTVGTGFPAGSHPASRFDCQRVGRECAACIAIDFRASTRLTVESGSIALCVARQWKPFRHLLPKTPPGAKAIVAVFMRQENQRFSLAQGEGNSRGFGEPDRGRFGTGRKHWGSGGG